MDQAVIKIGQTFDDQTMGPNGICDTVWTLDAGGESTLLFGRPNNFKIKNSIHVLADGYLPYEGPVAELLGEDYRGIRNTGLIHIDVSLKYGCPCRCR